MTECIEAVSFELDGVKNHLVNLSSPIFKASVSQMYLYNSPSLDDDDVSFYPVACIQIYMV